MNDTVHQFEMPDDLWKVRDLIQCEDHGAAGINVLFHQPPEMVLVALTTRKPCSRGKRQVIIPDDLSDQSRLVVLTACISAHIVQEQKRADIMQDMKVPMQVNLN